MNKVEQDTKEILFSILGSNFSEFDTSKIVSLFINCLKTIRYYNKVEEDLQKGKTTEIELSMAKSDLMTSISKLSLGFETLLRQTQSTKLDEIAQSVTFILVNLFLKLIADYE